MLEHLFGSRTRVKLLTLFVHHPEEGFYVRELTRRINTQINAVRREIQNLVDLGMLVETEGTPAEPGIKRPGLKRKYYVANAQYPLLQEVRSLLTKAHVLTEWKLHAQLQKIGELKYLAFLGIFSGQRNSPVDVFIVGDMETEPVRNLMQHLEKGLGFEINYTLMSSQDYKYRTDMADRFLESIIQSPKTVVVNKLEDRK